MFCFPTLSPPANCVTLTTVIHNVCQDTKKSGFHLKRRQNKQPNLHLQKPGSCVSLLPVTRSRARRVRKPRPCCGAARFHVSFHDKHFHRCTLILSIYFSVSPTAVFIGGPSRTGRRKIIFTPKRATCVIFSLLPSSSGSFSFAASNQPKTAPNSLRLSFRLDPPPPPTPKRSNTPRFVLLICDGCSLLCFLLQRAFSLSLPLAFVAEMCYQPLTSPPSLQNCAPIDFLNSRRGSEESLQDKKSLKKGKKKRKGKRDQDVKIPRNVSTFLAGEKATPAVRLSFYSLHKAYICVHTYTLSYKHAYIDMYIYSS